VSDVTDELTIDGLAHRVGMTVRNVRAYQSRGLIPAPELRGRTGYYGPPHVARLELIRDLQAEGFNLQSIKRILDRVPGDSLTDVLDFARAAAEPFSDEEPRVVTRDALVERWGDQLTPELAARTQKLGLVRPLGDGLFEVRSPRIERASEELAELGVPLETALEILATIRRHAEKVAKAYVELFLEHVWRPFEETGEPQDEWPRMREALDRLRPLASESLEAVFQIAMTEAVEHALDEELARIGEENGRKVRRPGEAGDARSGRRARSPRRSSRDGDGRARRGRSA
jgi:DNA-binding transcriptional MerR regulator